MSEPRKSYIRGYLIPNCVIRDSELFFEEIRDITDEIHFVDEYLNFLRDIFNLFFKEGVKNVQDLKRANDLYALLTLGGLSYYWRGFIEKWLEENFGKNLNISNFINNEFKKFSIITKRFYETYPADDRPGLNTSSLLVHLISTSALASCIAEEKQKIENLDPLEIQCIRASSFFHEIGKPKSRYNIINNSIELFKKYFEGIYADNILNLIINIIKGINDDNPSFSSRCVKIGSKLSLASDRLSEITQNILSNVDGIKEKFDKKEFWEEKEDQLKELTLDFLKRYENKLKEKEPLELIYHEKGIIALIRGDVRHIHEYTDHVRKLEELRNASKLLDYVLSIDLVSKLIKEKNVNPENIVYSSGGNIIIFSPSSKAKELTQFMEDLFYKATKEGLEMTTDYIYFYNEDEEEIQDSFGDLYSRLAIKIGAKKNELKEKRQCPVLFGAIKLCDSCNNKMASEKEPFPLGEILEYCNSCDYKFKLHDLRFLSLQVQWGDFYNKIREHIMEFISGVHLSNISEKAKKQNVEFKPHKLAIINSDGNLMSEFIAKSISLSDLYSRIIRISNSVFEIFEIIEKKIKRFFSEEDYVRFNFGKIYFGGDDILILVPGYLAIPISLTFTKEFYKKMGKKCTLSTGLFLCPNKFPIWTAITTARKLLKSAKNLGRLCKNNEMGVIDFQSFSSGLTVPKFVGKIGTKNRDKVFSRRPFRVCFFEKDDSKQNKTRNEIHYLLNNLIDKEYRLKMDLMEDYESLYTFVSNEINLLYLIDKEAPSVLRDFRNKAKRILSFFTYSSESFTEEKQKAIAFVLYQTGRQKENLGKNSYIKLFNLLGKVRLMDENKNNQKQTVEEDFLFFDSIELLKFLSGGLI